MMHSERYFRVKYCVFILLMLVHVGEVRAQQDRFFTPYQGLSNTAFFSIVQDHDGFLWFATTGGLNKFDGHSFTVYRHNPLDANSITSDMIQALLCDSKGRLWVGTNNSLQIYDRQHDNFRTWQMHYRDRQVNLEINYILEDKKGNIWLTTSVGLVRINPEDGNIWFSHQVLDNENNFIRELMNSATFDNEGKIWAGSDKSGLFIYDPATDKMQNLKHEPGINSICDNSILSVSRDKMGNIILGTQKGGISIFNQKTKRFNTVSYFNKPGNLFNSGVYSVITDSSGTTWVGTERNGLKKLNTQTGELTDANAEIAQENISDTKIHCFSDRQGNLWFGIDYAGVYLKKERIRPFYAIGKSRKEKDGLSSNIVKSILIDSKNNLWVGTDGGGLNRMNIDGHRLSIFTYSPLDHSSIPDNAVIAICEDKSKNLWIGTYLGGLSLFNSRNNTFQTFLIDSFRKGRDYNYVTSIVPADDGNLWIATNGGGLHLFDVKKHKFTRIQSVQIKQKNITLPGFLTELLIDNDGALWIASYNGLFCWDQKAGTYDSYTSTYNRLETDAVYSIRQTHDGYIWFGTASGLLRLDKKTKQIIRYNTSNGLPNNSVYGILEDAHGNLWVSTLNGLSKFQLDSKTFRNFYTYDGLPGNEFRPASCFKAKDGRMYFGGTSGLISFYPDSIAEISGFPTIVFTGMKLFNTDLPIGPTADGRVILEKSVNETSGITLRYSDNSFTIEFTAVEYFAPEKVKYAYQMEGFDQYWVEKDYPQRFAGYANLKPGKYKFRLKSTNADGKWNPQCREITFIIMPPFWRTWWAYIVYGILIIMVLVTIRKMVLFRINMRHNLQIERLEREKLEELNQSKMQFFSNVSHEFRTPLTLIIGPVERMLYTNPEPAFKKQIELIYRNAQRLLRLVNLLLDLQKVEKNEMRLRASLGNIVSFTQDVTLSFEELALQKKINLSFKSEVEKIDIWFDSDMMDKVLFNLLSNAFKFTPKGGSVRVIVGSGQNDSFPAPLNNYVSISVVDTGRGMKEEFLQKIFERFYQIEGSESDVQMGTGIGLHLSKHLVEQHHGIITVSSTEGHGSRFDVYIPAGHEHLRVEQKAAAKPAPQAQPVENIEVKEPNETGLKVAAKAKTSDPNPRVLIVEDDADVRSYIRLELQEEYDVIEAVDGLEGWSAAQKYMPDLIISDVMMPGMDGIELCSKIKSDLKTSHIPVIILTARTSIENRIEGLETGADSYIPKPFHPEHLRVRIEKLIELRRTLMSKFSKSVSFEAREMTLTSADERFLQRAINLVKDNISNPELNIEDMGTELGMSRVHLYRKLKALTNQTPSEFVRTIRLKQAAYLLSQNKLNISEVAYAVGFSSHQYFSTCFQNYFNMSPTEYSQKAFKERA